MISIVSLNPSVDRTLVVDGLNVGGLNRVVEARQDAGGKGVNVALAVSRLGLQAECIGFMYRDNGRIFENTLIANGTSYDFAWYDGAVRTNIKVVDSQNGLLTELNESGLPVPQSAIENMTDMVLSHAENSDYLVLTGSLPPGCPADYYKTLIHAVEGLGCRCVLDAEGAALKNAIEAKPFMIKPNRHELAMICEDELTDLYSIRDAAMRYIERGVSVVAVSLGDEGALITDGDETLYARRIAVDVKSTVGAGDSMVAGLLSGFLGENSLEESFRRGVACATAKCAAEGSRVFDKKLYKEFLDQVDIRRL